MAALRHDDAHLEAMDRALAGMRDYGLNTAEGQKADQDFHTVILKATGNEALAVLASTGGGAGCGPTRFKQRTNRLPRDPLADHVALRHAIASRDPAFASETMHELLRMALADMAGTRSSRRNTADKA